MTRFFRLWEKKRGGRRTGSKLAGSLGEALFFASLFLLGLVLLAGLIISQVVYPRPELFQFGFGFWLTVLVACSLVVAGSISMILAMLDVASAERRAALARRAADIELLSPAAEAWRNFPTVPRDTDLRNSPGVRLAFRLPLAQSHAWKLTVTTIFCVAWNSMAAVLVIYHVLSGEMSWPHAAILLPIVAVGAWAICAFVRQMLVHTAIGPTTVEISDHPLQPGEQYELYLAQSGRLWFESLEAALVCHEEVTYRQGTDIRTENCQVYRQPIFRDEGFPIEPGRPYERTCRLVVPTDAMHSFQSPHSGVCWRILVEGKARSWQPFARHFPVVVQPSIARRQA